MQLNSNEIQDIIPHRYPFLLIDRVVEMSLTDNTIIALKNVSVNEMHFVGHFAQKHIMPGVLIIEALAQAGAVLLLSKEEFKNKLAFFAGIDKAKFKRQVIPGDILTLKVELIKIKGPIGIASAKAYVNDELAVSGELKFVVEM